jgi:hypothetical protein
MTDEISDLHRVFFDHVDHAVAGCAMWSRLFSHAETAKEDFDTMKASAEPFFRLCRWNFLRGVVLDLSSMSDRATTTVKREVRDNLTARRVYEETDFGGDGSLQSLALNSLVRFEAVTSSPEFKRLRDRVVAHTDLATAVGADAFPAVELNALELAMRCLSEFRARIATAVARSCGNLATGEGLAEDSKADAAVAAAEALLSVLRRGLTA